ncbi:MAG: hypothetical protein ACNS63_07310 [Candidatus Nitrospinota bacterium M3_3B_026]
MTETENTSETGASDPAREAGSVADLNTRFQLSRVVALLGLLAGIFALGFISMVYLNMDDRLSVLEKSYPPTVKSLKSRLTELDRKLADLAASPKAAADGGGETKKLLIGSELSRSLYLMRYMAGDESLSDEARRKAATIHAEVDALLKELKAGQ